MKFPKNNKIELILGVFPQSKIVTSYWWFTLFFLMSSCYEITEDIIESPDLQAHNFMDSELTDESKEYTVAINLNGQSPGEEVTVCFGDKLDFEISTNFRSDMVFDFSYYIQFSNNSGGARYSLCFDAESGMSQFSTKQTFYALKPGRWNITFELRRTAEDCQSYGENYYFDFPLTITFPEISDEDEVFVNSKCEYGFRDLWSATQDRADEHSKRELGAWIYATFKVTGENRNYDFVIDSGDWAEGYEVFPCGGGSISADAFNSVLNEKIPICPIGIDTEESKLAVANIHAHTTLEYCVSESDGPKARKVGISDGDKDSAHLNQLPMFVYDYEAETITDEGNPCIVEGLSKEASASWQFFSEVKQRPTPISDYTQCSIVTKDINK